MIRIHINIQSDGFEAYRRSLNELVRDLRRLEQGSPFRFEIIGYPSPAPSISLISRGDRRQAFEMLRDAHRNVAPRLYSPSIAGGGPIR